MRSFLQERNAAAAAYTSASAGLTPSSSRAFSTALFAFFIQKALISAQWCATAATREAQTHPKAENGQAGKLPVDHVVTAAVGSSPYTQAWRPLPATCRQQTELSRLLFPART